MLVFAVTLAQQCVCLLAGTWHEPGLPSSLVLALSFSFAGFTRALGVPGPMSLVITHPAPAVGLLVLQVRHELGDSEFFKG